VSRYFEDFAVGQRLDCPERKVTEDDLGPVGTVSGDVLAHELGLRDEPVVALLDTSWRYPGPVRAGDTLRFEVTVTRCRRRPSGAQGTVNRHVVVRDQHGERVQQGRVAVLVRARGPGVDPVGRAFGTVAWGQALAGRLADDERFTGATASWDGTIGVRCGDDEVQLRIYKGAVLEATRRAPHGATFTVEADELTWTELLTGPRNDFTRRTMAGQFAARGDGYEYLRLTKALTVLVDIARELGAQR
jgi:acyl dehydratase/putative sterol carrier protein